MGDEDLPPNTSLFDPSVPQSASKSPTRPPSLEIKDSRFNQHVVTLFGFPPNETAQVRQFVTSMGETERIVSHLNAMAVVYTNRSSVDAVLKYNGKEVRGWIMDVETGDARNLLVNKDNLLEKMNAKRGKTLKLAENDLDTPVKRSTRVHAPPSPTRSNPLQESTDRVSFSPNKNAALATADKQESSAEWEIPTLHRFQTEQKPILVSKQHAKGPEKHNGFIGMVTDFLFGW
jgi:hypothetical protein